MSLDPPHLHNTSGDSRPPLAAEPLPAQRLNLSPLDQRNNNLCIRHFEIVSL